MDLIGGGPLCPCGERQTARVGESALTRQCQKCGQTIYFRVVPDKAAGGTWHLVPLSADVALALDDQRSRGRAA